MAVDFASAFFPYEGKPCRPPRVIGVRAAYGFVGRGHGYLAGELPDGITTDETVPVSATVRAVLRTPDFPETDGIPVSHTVSDVAGTWRIDGVDPNTKFDVIGRLDTRNDAMMADVKPSDLDALTIHGTLVENVALDGLVSTVYIDGGVAPYTVNVVAGTAPVGLSFSMDGHNLEVTGSSTDATPTDYTFTLEFEDSTGVVAEAEYTVEDLQASVALDIYNKLTSWWEMGEASGTRNDSLGTNHLGVVSTVSTAQGVRGVGDVAASFAGTGALTVASNSTLQVPSGGGNHCFFGWVYFTNITAAAFVLSKWNASGSSAMEYSLQVSASVLYGQNGGSSYYSASNTAPAINGWHFVVVWRDSADGKVRMQVDNGTIYVSASASNPTAGANTLAFGQAGSSTSARLSGRIQRWGWIKGSFLTADERTYLYNSGTGRTWTELATAAGH